MAGWWAGDGGCNWMVNWDHSKRSLISVAYLLSKPNNEWILVIYPMFSMF
jgi:hypothetical protein